MIKIVTIAGKWSFANCSKKHELWDEKIKSIHNLLRSRSIIIIESFGRIYMESIIIDIASAKI